MLAYSKLDAGLKKILDQLRLPLTAALSATFVGKRYTVHEWVALLIVLLAICSFYMADVKHDEVTEMHTFCRYPENCFEEPPYHLCALRVDGPRMIGTAIPDVKNSSRARHDIESFPIKAGTTDLMGLIFSLAATFLNCMGSLLSERLMKNAASTPFSTQKVQMEMTGFPVAIAMSFIVPVLIDAKGGKAIWWTKNEAEGSGEGFFQGYNRLTFIAIAIDTAMSWMGGILVKQFSSVVKIIAKCFVLLLTVLCTGTFMKACQADPLPMTMYSLAFIIAAATLLFAAMPKVAPPQSADRPIIGIQASQGNGGRQ
jgi:drug/metabolite transporter (DMT)-like permease